MRNCTPLRVNSNYLIYPGLSRYRKSKFFQKKKKKRSREDDPIASRFRRRALRALDAEGVSRDLPKIPHGFLYPSIPRRDADGVRRHSSFLVVWYHVPCWLKSNTQTRYLQSANSVGLHYALLCVAAYPVAPHPPTGFVPAPTQPPTYGGKIKIFSDFLLKGAIVLRCEKKKNDHVYILERRTCVETNCLGIRKINNDENILTHFLTCIQHNKKKSSFHREIDFLRF